MGFIGDMFSSDKGAGYQAAGAGYGTAGNAPMTAKTEQWVNNDVINAQQGIVNQGMGRSQGAMNQQQQFINQLGQQAQGKGPNPAQMMLNQNTGQNVQNQSAMMASQRGAGSNVGMIGRQAAQQGAGIQQQAVGQAATLGAQQQIAAQQLQGSALQNYNQNAQGYQGLTQQQQQAFLNAQAQSNASNVAMQSNINNANAGIANTNTQGQQGIVGGILGGIGSIFGLAEGGMVPGKVEGGQPEPGGSPWSLGVDTNLHGDSAGPSSFAAKWLNDMPQAAPKPAAPVPQPLATAPQTGQTPTQAPSPANAGPSPTPQQDQGHAPIAFPNEGAKKLEEGVSGFIAGPAKKAKSMMGGGGGGGMGGQAAGGEAAGGADMASMAMLAANKGGKVPKKYSPGGKVHGKAKVAGDSLQNDTVSAKLSPGEIVIPRTVINGKDPVKASARFVQAILAKEGMRGRK